MDVCSTHLHILIHPLAIIVVSDSQVLSVLRIPLDSSGSNAIAAPLTQRIESLLHTAREVHKQATQKSKRTKQERKDEGVKEETPADRKISVSSSSDASSESAESQSHQHSLEQKVKVEQKPNHHHALDMAVKPESIRSFAPAAASSGSMMAGVTVSSPVSAPPAAAQINHGLADTAPVAIKAEGKSNRACTPIPLDVKPFVPTPSVAVTSLATAAISDSAPRQLPKRRLADIMGTIMESTARESQQ